LLFLLVSVSDAVYYVLALGVPPNSLLYWYYDTVVS
jgi:hypothetical protein